MRNFTFFFFCLFSLSLFSQNSRYLDDVFSSVTTTTVEYSEVYNLDVEVYEPVGDTEVNRPLIIFAHGGSFIAGSNQNPSMITLCESFAKKGYVTASLQYRLGTFLSMLDSLSMIDVVMKALGDAKAAVRYFRMDADNGNSFNINPNIIFFGGNSAGGVIGCHLGILTDPLELGSDQYLLDVLNNNGGFEGNSGNAGYSSEINAVINLAGGINKTSWISSEDKPIVSCHGDQDDTVPYYCGPALGLSNLPQLCGSGAMEPVLNQNNVVNDLLLFSGSGHTPWEGNTTVMNQVIDVVKNFLYPLLTPAGNLEKDKISFTVFPNPSSNVISLSFENNLDVKRVSLVNSVGKTLYKKTIIKDEASIDLSLLPPGLYTVVVIANMEKTSKKIVLF